MYIGQTNNLKSRLEQHLTKNWKSARFTRDNDDFQLVYYEKFKTRVEARHRETQLKGWSRSKKDALINGDLHQLKVLSRRKT